MILYRRYESLVLDTFAAHKIIPSIAGKCDHPTQPSAALRADWGSRYCPRARSAWFPSKWCSKPLPARLCIQKRSLSASRTDICPNQRRHSGSTLQRSNTCPLKRAVSSVGLQFALAGKIRFGDNGGRSTRSFVVESRRFSTLIKL